MTKILKILISIRLLLKISICLLLFVSISIGLVQVPEVTTAIISYMSTGYKFNIVPFDEGSGFEQPYFDDSDFSIGNAGFGSLSYLCGLNDPTYVKTEWPEVTDILLRKEFKLPQGAKDLKVSVAIDNDVQVFINGYDISGGLQIHEGCPERDSFVFTAPDDILIPGVNLIAVRGRDRGGPSYLDIQVQADVPPFMEDNGTKAYYPRQPAVEIQNFAFHPQTVNIDNKTTVTWKNLDIASHTVTSVDGIFDSGSLSTGNTFSYTFSQYGIFEYKCNIHPLMPHGFVTVENQKYI